jgi:hypothetical protein
MRTFDGSLKPHLLSVEREIWYIPVDGTLTFTQVPDASTEVSV